MDYKTYTNKQLNNTKNFTQKNYIPLCNIDKIMLNNIDYLRHLDKIGKARPCVLDNIERMLLCNSIYLGWDAFECHHCHNENLLFHKCHSRFCTSCGAKYTKQLAAKITSFTLDVTHRHIVFTIPEELRIFFLKDRHLLNLLFVAARNTICAVVNASLLNKLRRKAKKNHTTINNSYYLFKDFHHTLDFGMIASLHTFGRDLKFNPHIHALVPELIYDSKNNKTKSFTHFPYEKMRKTFQFELLRLLEDALGDSFKPIKNKIYQSKENGFYVYAKPFSDEPDLDDSYTKGKNYSKDIEDCITYAVRYAARPAMSENRITEYNEQSDEVTWYYDDHKDNQHHIITESSKDFIHKLIIHIPDEQFRMIRYYGFYANASNKTLDKIHQLLGNLSKLSKEVRNKFKTRNLNKLKYRTSCIDSFNLDPLKCTCGTLMNYCGSYEPMKGVKDVRAYRKESIDEMRRLRIPRVST